MLAPIALANRVPARAVQFAGWFALGVVAFGVELVLLAALHQWLRIPLWIASAVAAELVLLGRFLSTDHFVFGHTTPTFGRCWRFHASALGSFVVSWIVLNGSATLLHVPYVGAAFLGSVAAFGWSGLTNFLWVWRPYTPANAPSEAAAAGAAPGRAGWRAAAKPAPRRVDGARPDVAGSSGA